MDTVLNKKLISDFYESNKNNFKLREPLFKIRFISFPIDNVVRDEIIIDLGDLNLRTKFLDSLTFQFSSYFLADSIWLNKYATLEKVSFLNNNNSIKYLKREKYYEVKDSLDLYLFEVIEKLEKNQVAPFAYIENTIKNIVFNKKKIRF